MADLTPIEAILPLPTCRSNSGCRSVVENINKIGTENSEKSFDLEETLYISALVSHLRKFSISRHFFQDKRDSKCC